MSYFEEAFFSPSNRSMRMTFYSDPTVRHTRYDFLQWFYYAKFTQYDILQWSCCV